MTTIDRRSTEENWYDKPMRWAQLAFTEDDPGNYEPDLWLDYFERTHVDGVCLSAGGYVAYYPTEIPLHHRSIWMEEGDDPFGYLVKECRRRDMAIIARTDPHAVHQDVFEAHPDWIAVTADGQKRRHWSKPDVWVTCALGPYNFEYMTDVHREIVSTYDVDAIFSNRWAGHGICYCEHCRRSFWDAYHMPLPRRRDADDPAWRNYVAWRQERLFDLARLWNDTVREANPHACYVPNSGGGALSDLDMRTLSELIPLLVADRQGRRDIMTPWAFGKNAKEFRGAFGQKPVGGMFSVGLEETHRWKDSVQNPAELRVWMAEGIANGMRPWYIKFCGRVWDDRWMAPVAQVFDWHHDIEDYLKGAEPMADVALVYSQRTAALYGGQQAQEKVEDPILGWYQALVEARIPFEMVHDRTLGTDRIASFRTLILPNVAILSDEQCQQLREFVRDGGNLVATLETSLYDEEGRPREDLALGDLFGAQATGPLEGPYKNTYFNTEPDTEAEEMLTGLEDAQRLIGAVYALPVKAVDDLVSPPITRVPRYPDLPMEEVYPRQPRSDEPGVHLRQVSESRIVYFPWDVDRLYWEVLNPDHGLLLSNAVRWANGGEQAVEVEGPGLLDVTLWRKDDALTLHLVNLSNPNSMRGAYRQIMPVGEQVVRLRLPDDAEVEGVHLLYLDQAAETEQDGRWLTVRVPSVTVHEIVAVDLA